MKKVWSKIGKGIKKVFMKIGKFMNKIGVVGQIALGLILPGIGSALGAWAGTASSTVFGAAAKGFVNAAINIGTKVGSVFKTVTQGVTKVIGQTVGTALNKAGLSEVVGTFGIDITQMKNFTGTGGVFETAGKAITDSVAAGTDLFSMDTLTGTNKYAIGKLAPKATDFDIKRGDGIADSVRSAADDATNAFTGTPPADLADSVRSAADNATNAFTEISKPDSIMAKPTTVEKVVTETVDDSFIGKLKTGVSDGLDAIPKKVGDTLANAPSKVLNAGLSKLTGMGPQAAQITSYSSQPAQFTAVGTGADSMLMNTGAIQQDMSAGLQGMFGNPSAIFNDLQAKQETENYQAQFGGGR